MPTACQAPSMESAWVSPRHPPGTSFEGCHSTQPHRHFQEPPTCQHRPGPDALEPLMLSLCTGCAWMCLRLSHPRHTHFKLDPSHRATSAPQTPPPVLPQTHRPPPNHSGTQSVPSAHRFLAACHWSMCITEALVNFAVVSAGRQCWGKCM